jgi:hypothetical protein
MIMPADPQVGDVNRPENIAGLVFEEMAVAETDKTVDGPRGSVEGAIVGRELHGNVLGQGLRAHVRRVLQRARR